MPWDRKRLLGYVETIQLILVVTDKHLCMISFNCVTIIRFFSSMYSLMSQYKIWCAEILSAIKQGKDNQFMMSPADQTDWFTETNVLPGLNHIPLGDEVAT